MVYESLLQRIDTKSYRAMSLISLIHPSRGRAKKSYDNSKDWVSKIGDGVKWELLVSIDRSDSKNSEYGDLYFQQPLSCNPEYHPFESHICICVGDNESVVQAANVAAQKSKGDILIYLSDDFKCPDNWGQLVLKEFEGVTEPRLIKVDDCLQPFHVAVLTIPIMNRALYEKLGYFWHPEYKSMFVDEDLYWTAKKLGALKMCPHLKFPHEHVSIGKADNDETYKRSAANWEQGKAVFARRKAAGFPI